MMQFTSPIVENTLIARNIYRLSFVADQSAATPMPGQFLQIKIGEGLDPLLRRPISICDYDHNSNLVTLIYRIVGRGTELLSKKKAGELIDVFGPLGTGFPYADLVLGQRVVLIGGGIGTPPLYYLAKELHKRGIKITTIIGCLSQVDRILYNEFAELGEVRVATVDGSCGLQGTVLDALDPDEKWDCFYSCGPIAMLRALQDFWGETKIDGFISLEERMACGIGACFGCVVKVDRDIYPDGYKKVCVDGPVFAFREVIL